MIASLASLGWTVYRHLKNNRDAAKADRAEMEGRIVVLPLLLECLGTGSAGRRVQVFRRLVNEIRRRRVFVASRARQR